MWDCKVTHYATAVCVAWLRVLSYNEVFWPAHAADAKKVQLKTSGYKTYDYSKQ